MRQEAMKSLSSSCMEAVSGRWPILLPHLATWQDRRSSAAASCHMELYRLWWSPWSPQIHRSWSAQHSAWQRWSVIQRLGQRLVFGVFNDCSEICLVLMFGNNTNIMTLVTIFYMFSLTLTKNSLTVLHSYKVLGAFIHWSICCAPITSRWGRQEAVLCSRCNCVCLYIRVQLKMPHSTGDELSKFSGASSLKCHPPSSTVYHRPVLNADPMRLRGCFTGQRLNGPVCWPAPGLPMMNGQTQGLCPGVKRLPRTVQRDLGAGTQKSRCSGLIDDLWTWSLTSSLHGCRVERLVVTIWLMYWSADTGLLLKI